MRILLLLSLIATSFSLTASNAFTIKGTLENDTYNGKTVYLKSFEGLEKFETMDSATVKGRTFEIKGVVKKHPIMAVLQITSPAFAQPLAIEPGNIELTQSASRNIVKGGTKTTELLSFFEAQEEFGKKAQELDKLNTDGMDELIISAKKSLLDFVSNNKSNNLGEYIVISAADMLDKIELSDIIDGMSPEFIASKHGASIKSYTESSQISVGDMFKDIKLPNENGKTIAISDYVGKNKVILLDFWASWCAPCRREMPTVVEAYKKYKSKGFEVIGISLDDSQDAWTRAIKSMNMTWPQMSDLGGWKSEAAALYNVTSIPLTLLLDKDGKVIAMNLRGQQLLNKLDELLK